MYINRNASLLVRLHYRLFVHKNEKVDFKVKEKARLIFMPGKGNW